MNKIIKKILIATLVFIAMIFMKSNTSFGLTAGNYITIGQNAGGYTLDYSKNVYCAEHQKTMHNNVKAVVEAEIEISGTSVKYKNIYKGSGTIEGNKRVYYYILANILENGGGYGYWSYSRHYGVYSATQKKLYKFLSWNQEFLRQDGVVQENLWSSALKQGDYNVEEQKAWKQLNDKGWGRDNENAEYTMKIYILKPTTRTGVQRLLYVDISKKTTTTPPSSEPDTPSKKIETKPVTITKVDQYTNKPLEGAEFIIKDVVNLVEKGMNKSHDSLTLLLKDENGPYIDSNVQDGYIYEYIKSISFDNDGNVIQDSIQWTSNKSEAYVFKTNKEGRIELFDLPATRNVNSADKLIHYVIEEISSTPGYPTVTEQAERGIQTMSRVWEFSADEFPWGMNDAPENTGSSITERDEFPWGVDYIFKNKDFEYGNMVEIIKKDKTTKEELEGFKFILSKKVNNVDQYLKAEYDTNVTEEYEELENGQIVTKTRNKIVGWTWTDNKDEAYRITTQRAGQTEVIRGLEARDSRGNTIEYTLTEVEIPEEYKNIYSLDEEQQKITFDFTKEYPEGQDENRKTTKAWDIKGTQTYKATITMFNSKKDSVKLQILKKDKYTGRTVSGAKFIVYCVKDGKTLYLSESINDGGNYKYKWSENRSDAKKLITNKSGYILLADLPVSGENGSFISYTIEETDPADGYNDDKGNYNQKQTITFEKDKEVTCVFENIPDETEMILIDKKDRSDGMEMGGVSFIIQNRSTGKWIKTATLVLKEEEEDERVTYELGNASVSQDDWWTSNESEAMRFTTGSREEYRAIKIINIPEGKYIAKEVSNSYGDYQDNIGRTFSLSTTTLDDFTNVNTLYNSRDGNNYGNVKISGKVWLEGQPGNKSNQFNDEYNAPADATKPGENDDKLLQYVKVYWRTPGGRLIASTETKGDGTYTMYARISYGFCEWWIDTSMYNNISNSYVEFGYNGLEYTTVGYTTDGSKKNSSKVMENPSSRAELDNSFAEISNRGVMPNGTRLTYTYDNSNSPRKATMTAPKGITDFEVTADTRTPLSKYRFLKQIGEGSNSKEVYPLLSTGTGSGCLKHHYVSCSNPKHGSHHRCDERGSKIIRWEITDIDCGLVKREQPDIAIVSDIGKVDVIMKGQQYTYKYGHRGLPDQGAEYKVSFSDGTVYRRPVNPSDVAYINKEGNNSEDLEVYVTYNIKVNNQSNTLMMDACEIVNYFDANYTLADDKWSSMSKNRRHL